MASVRKAVKAVSKIQAYKANKIIYLGDAQRVIRADVLTATQLKIAMFSAAQVAPDDTAATRYSLTFHQFAELSKMNENTEGGKDYKRIFSDARNLMRLGMDFTDSNGDLVAFNWLTGVRVSEKKGTVTYSIDPELLPFYKTQQGSFTVISLIDYMPLRSKYSLMLYEFLSKWKNAGQVYQTTTQLREQLQIPDNLYARVSSLRKQIVEAVAEINTTATNGFTVKMIEKRGQWEKTEGVTFVITPVGAAAQPISQDAIDLIDLLKASGVSAPMAKSLAGSYSRARILGNLATAKKLSAAGQIKKSLPAAICAAIKDDYAGVEPAEPVAVAPPAVVAAGPAAAGAGEQETCAKCGGRGIFRDDSIRTGSPFVVCSCKVSKKATPVPYSKVPDPEPPDPDDPDAPWAVQGVAAEIAKALAAKMQ